MYNLNNIVEEQILYVHTNGEWQEDTIELFLSNIVKEKKQNHPVSCEEKRLSSTFITWIYPL